MASDPERTWPDEERRTEDAEDIGRRRRVTDLGESAGVSEVRAALARHERDAIRWRARADARIESVEQLRALLDGSAGNDGGIIGAIAAIQTDLKLLRDDVKDLKTKTGTKDGQEPPSRFERVMTVLGPILVVLITTIGGIVLAYFALRGQLAGLNPGGGTGR